jgi:hypothetical protein
LQPKSAPFLLELHIIVPHAPFTAVKLRPGRNALRSAQRHPNCTEKGPHRSKQVPTAPQGNGELLLLATPVYNAGVLSDMYYQKHCCDVASSVLGSEEWQFATRLLELWLRAQVPMSSHWGALLDALVAKLAEEIREGRVVCGSQLFFVCSLQIYLGMLGESLGKLFACRCSRSNAYSCQ